MGCWTGQVGRTCALEYPVDVNGCLHDQTADVRAVACEVPLADDNLVLEDSRKPGMGGKSYCAGTHRIVQDGQCIALHASDGLKRLIEVLFFCCGDRDNFETEIVSCGFARLYCMGCVRFADIRTAIRLAWGKSSRRSSTSLACNRRTCSQAR